MVSTAESRHHNELNPIFKVKIKFDRSLKLKIRNSLLITAAVLFGFNWASGQQIGEVDTMGFTYYDLQHAGSIGRLIGIDINDGVHCAWSNGMNEQKAKYSYKPVDGGWSWSNGTPVTQLSPTMSASIYLLSERYSIVAYRGLWIDEQYHVFAGVEYEIGGGVFQQAIMSNPPGESITEPQVITSSDTIVHMIGYGRITGDKRPLFYNRSVNRGISWLPEWILVDSVRTHAAVFTAAPNGKVALAWAHPLNSAAVNPNEFVNNDLVYVESSDGINWDFSDTVNVTNFAAAVHPNSDSLRLFKDISMTYDQAYNLHIVYSATGYYYNSTHTQLMTTPGSKIYHYSQAAGFTKITGQLFAGIVIPLDNRRLYDKPCISFNYYGGDNALYCIWAQFDDPYDLSQQGYPNGEIFGSYSENGGLDWSEPFSITNTHSPGAPGGYCLSEDYPSLAAEINDTLHVLYLLDNYPASEQGQQTYVVYQKIPVDLFQYHAVSVEPHENIQTPEQTGIIDVFPNPFNSGCMIKLHLERTETISIRVYDLQGRVTAELFSGQLTSGIHDFNFNADNLSSGIYFVRVSADLWHNTAKILLMK